MMKMRTNINEVYLKETRSLKGDVADLGCVTCHHCSPKVRLLEDELYSAYQSKGFDASIEKYNSLRKEFYGAAVYDFLEGSLVSFSSKLLNYKKFDDAIKALNKNLELFPQSTRSLNTLGNAYIGKGEKETAVSYFEKTLALDPQNRFAKQMLNRLREEK